ncbi:hypothetical protein F2P81_011557 [Scophthalmus maximus]|uniref:Uncharacterized protein n=1 Tax=Scophthalmus maximus TaxID=52904 RepID=A0A6A4SU93_SCOMX|nr:hypothetical protein F2P81_011557 [Scophthalmus maximus]
MLEPRGQSEGESTLFSSDVHTHYISDWRTVSDPKHAARLFSQDLLHRNKDSKCQFLSVDIRRDKEEQDRALVTFYKRDNVQWASPLQCKLQGNAAIVKIFEGESDHLIPSVSQELLDNNMFTVAGRMIGHSFLHHGPSFPGLSPAIVHTLLGGPLETTPVTVRDCPDLDIRDSVKMLDGDAELTEFDSVRRLCLSWNLPAPNATNRKWLSEKLLFHTVIERTRHQINQFQNGLKETGLWPLLIHRRDVIPILFPRESEAQLTPQMILDCIIWPSSITIIFESYKELDDDDESAITDVHRVSGYLKTFVGNGDVQQIQTCAPLFQGVFA